MATTLEERTVQPPTTAKTKTAVSELAKVLAPKPRPGRVRGPVGRRPQVVVKSAQEDIEVPQELYDVIRLIVDALSKGQAVVIEPLDAVLTTQQAADKMHISRPTLIKLLEAERIPYHTRGRHRRIRLADLLEYEQKEMQARRDDLDRLSYEAAHDGTADAIDEYVRTR